MSEQNGRDKDASENKDAKEPSNRDGESVSIRSPGPDPIDVAERLGFIRPRNPFRAH